MLESFRRSSKSPVILVLFAMLIAVFVLTFNPAQRVAGGRGTPTEVMAEVGNVIVDAGELELAMRLSPEPPTGAPGPEQAQRKYRYDNLRMPYTGTNSELALYTSFDGTPPANFREKVLTELIEGILTAEDAHKIGLAVSDTELSRRVLAVERTFGAKLVDDNGAFDSKKYDSFVRNSLGTNKTVFENFLRREILRDKMIQLVTAGISLTPSEVDGLFAAENKRPRVEFVAIDAESAAKAITVTDADADAYIAANADKVQAAYDAKSNVYKVPDRWSVRGVMVAAPGKEGVAEDKKAEVDGKWAEAKTKADAIKADLDKAWGGETALDPIAPPKVEGQDAPPVAEGDAKKATELQGDEKLARLGQFFGKVAAEKSEHNMTKDSGGKFVDDLSAEALARTPFGEAVAAAVAGAAENTLVGPVEGKQGLWVILVEKKLPGSVTPLDEALKRVLAKEIVAIEKGAAEMDNLAAALQLAADATPTTALAEVLKRWNNKRFGKDDGPFNAQTSGAIGTSPMSAMQTGLEMFGMAPPPPDEPGTIPGMGKLPEVANAVNKLNDKAPVAKSVFKSEDGKVRYVVRLATDKEGDEKTDAKLKEALAKNVTQMRKLEAWHMYTKKLLLTAEAAHQFKRTEAFAADVATEQARMQKAAGGAAGSAPPAPGAAPAAAAPAAGGMKIKIGDQEVPIQAVPAAAPAAPVPSVPPPPKAADAPAKASK